MTAAAAAIEVLSRHFRLLRRALLSELLSRGEAGLAHGQFRVVEELRSEVRIALGSIEHLLGQFSLQLADLRLGKGLLALRGHAFRHVRVLLSLSGTACIGQDLNSFSGSPLLNV
jgi:hypothetical protein